MATTDELRVGKHCYYDTGWGWNRWRGIIKYVDDKFVLIYTRKDGGKHIRPICIPRCAFGDSNIRMGRLPKRTRDTGLIG